MTACLDVTTLYHLTADDEGERPCVEFPQMYDKPFDGHYDLRAYAASKCSQCPAFAVCEAYSLENINELEVGAVVAGRQVRVRDMGGKRVRYLGPIGDLK